MIGDKILELRKKNDLSQEKLAEKIDVTRQTISNCELGETSPDLKQASELAKIFNVTLDELVGTNREDILYDKVNSVEEKSNLILKKLSHLSWISLLYFALFLIIVLVLWNLFCSVYYANTVSATSTGVEAHCMIDNKYYKYSVMKNIADGTLVLTTTDNELLDNFNISDYDDVNVAIKDIEKYVLVKNGKCGIDPDNPFNN